MRALLSFFFLLSLPFLCAGWGALPHPQPLHVFVQIQYVEIAKIDGVEQAFSADFFMLTTWAAPKKNYWDNASNSTMDKDHYWNPQLEFINGREEVRKLVGEDDALGFLDTVSFPLSGKYTNGSSWSYTLPDGWIWITDDQRYQSSFTTPLQMERFPFDTQETQLYIESFFDDTQTNLHFADPAAITKVIPPGMPDVVGWDPKESRYFDSHVLYEYNGRTYHRLTVATRLQRDPTFYLTKIVAGVVLLVYMCIWVFALAVDEADRMMGTLQVFAGLITFLFVAAQDTPKVPYQTRLDLFMLYSFFCVAFIMFVHSTLYYWREADLEDEEEDKKADEADKQKQIGNGEASNDGLGAEYNKWAASQAAAATPATKEENVWKIRTKERPPFTFGRWFRGLILTRKFDAFFVIFISIMYGIGVAVILGTARKSD